MHIYTIFTKCSKITFMYLITGASLIIFLLVACTGNPSPKNQSAAFQVSRPFANVFSSLGEIPLPDGFSRTSVDAASFAWWLRKLPLKSDNTVYLYNGAPKPNQQAQFAVLDVSVGDRDLQQCADAVMRLRAEYLYAQERFESINFTDNEGGVYQFDEPYSRPRFDKYLQRVFGMCGTASLSKQMKQVYLREMNVGDVFIKGGFPGHAVIVVDMAKNRMGKKIYLLAQSYMPAQDIHILNNPNDGALSPWYELNDETSIITPEYRFTSSQLKTW
ncbi:MAG: hypothetical protein EOO03_06000 [Chitinophagaceae bacterium]|nr:MAG: hypothetical protein EOO03_06000 [Chitinophagaceae bacterium]